MIDSVITATHEHAAQVSLLLFMQLWVSSKIKALFIILMVLKVLNAFVTIWPDQAQRSHLFLSSPNS